MAIGKCPKNKLLKGYIELELQLREFDRCRKLYEKYLEFNPENCTTWIKFAELETILGDVERARSIFELAIGQPRLDMPEVSVCLTGAGSIQPGRPDSTDCCLTAGPLEVLH